MECPKCRANNPDDSAYCSLCFATLIPKDKQSLSLSAIDKKLEGCMAKLGLRRDDALSRKARALGLDQCVYELTARPGFAYPIGDLGGNNFAFEELDADRAAAEQKLTDIAERKKGT